MTGRAVTFVVILRGFVRSVKDHRSPSAWIPRLSSWNLAMYLAVSVIRSFLNSHSRDLRTLRAVTDFSFLPTIPRGAMWRDTHVDGIRTEIVWPRKWGSALPTLEGRRIVLYLHGGGGVLCSSLTHRAVTHGIAVTSDAVLVVPNYRRAPEHCFTEAVADCLTMYEWLLQQSREHPDCISLAGDSAGGALVVLTLCKIREKGFPMPSCGLLLSPWCDVTSVPTAAGSAAVDYITADALDFMGSMLVREGSDIEVVNPSRQKLTGFPPLLIQYGDSEILSDQIRTFAKWCESHKVQVELIEYFEMVHVPHFFSIVSREGHRALLDLAQFMTSVHTRY